MSLAWSEQERWHIKQQIIITIIILLLNKLRYNVRSVQHYACMMFSFICTTIFTIILRQAASLSSTSATILKINMESVFRLFE